MSTKKPENITVLPYRERMRLVKERMDRLRYPKIESLPKSAKVLAAEKVMEDYHSRNEQHMDNIREGRRIHLHKISDAAILGDMEEVVRLLRQADQSVS